MNKSIKGNVDSTARTKERVLIRDEREREREGEEGVREGDKKRD